MAALSIHESNIVITCGSKALMLDIGPEDSSESNRSPTLIEPPFGDNHAPKIDVEECQDANDMQNQHLVLPTNIMLASFSSCNKLLALCSFNKHLSIWNTTDCSLLSDRVILRAASAVKFTPSGRSVVVADKCGDAYTYSVENPLEKGALLLGHLSMLLDILVTPDENYVITCDRDEKIRVSNFPNAYNIHTFCLGHEQFVSHIDLLPNDLSVLVSSSGDGTIMFWDYKCGKHLYTVKCSDNWYSSNSNNESDNECEILPVKSFSSCKVDPHSSMICAMLSGISGCLIYKACCNDCVQCDLIQVLCLRTEPWNISFFNTSQLWILAPEVNEPLNVYVLTSGQFTKDSTLLNKYALSGVTYINEHRQMFASISPPSPLTVLYKRKFENVQDYHERKKNRMLSNS